MVFKVLMVLMGRRIDHSIHARVRCEVIRQSMLFPLPALRSLRFLIIVRCNPPVVARCFGVFERYLQFFLTGIRTAAQHKLNRLPANKGAKTTQPTASSESFDDRILEPCARLPNQIADLEHKKS